MTYLASEVLAQAMDRLTWVANSFPYHIDRDGVGLIKTRQDDVLSLLAALDCKEKALREAEKVLAMVERTPMVDPAHGDEVEALGLRIGFGALMSSAQASWRKQADVKGGEFVAGPCFATVIETLKTIRQALGTPPPPTDGEVK